jgi:hypothetical protein
VAGAKSQHELDRLLLRLHRRLRVEPYLPIFSLFSSFPLLSRHINIYFCRYSYSPFISTCQQCYQSPPHPLNIKIGLNV